jgi:hypothetical protein
MKDMSEPATKADLRAAVRSLKIWTAGLAVLLIGLLLALVVLTT